MMCTHIIEKGLALRNTKPYYGKDVILRVVEDAIALCDHREVPKSVIQSAIESVEAYIEYNNRQHGTDEERVFLLGIEKRFDVLVRQKKEPCHGSTVIKTRAEIEEYCRGSIAEAIKNRHSLRMFSDSEVDMTAVDRAISAAQRSPSACNLQPVRLTIFKSREMIDQILTLQAGARGFFSEVKLLFIVSFELSLHIGPRSRNQGYTDGGLFSQSLMLALLGEGIGTCPLNWAQEIATDQKMRALVKLPNSENIIMLMAAGNLPESFDVAGSQRVDLNIVRRYGD
jgi:nitroreductase